MRQTYDRRGNWAKIDALCDLLDPRSPLFEPEADYFLWMDTDALFVRFDKDIASEIDPAIDLKMAWHRIPGVFHDPAHYNTGVMLIRKSEWSLEFFRKVQKTGQIDHKWADQATIHYLLGYHDVLYKDRPRITGLMPNNVGDLGLEWNSIPGVVCAERPMVLHHAGVARKYREQLIKLDAVTTIDDRPFNYRNEVMREFRIAFETVAQLEKRVADLTAQLEQARQQPLIDREKYIARLEALILKIPDLEKAAN